MDDFITTASSRSSSAPAGKATGRTPPTEIISRIALNETAETSVSANEDGMRKLAMAAATISDLFRHNVSAGRQAAAGQPRRQRWSARPSASSPSCSPQTGIVENRVKDASDRIKTQVDLFESHIIDIEGVDPYEASTRVADLLQQIETSYALTARIQQLSLLEFLT